MICGVETRSWTDVSIPQPDPKEFRDGVVLLPETVCGRECPVYSSNGAPLISSRNPKFSMSAAAPEYGFFVASAPMTSMN